MGCDAMASEEGTLVIEISDYKTGKVLDTVVIKGYEPGHPFAVEIVEGDTR